MEVFSFRNGSYHVVKWEGGSAKRLAMAELALAWFSALLTILVALSTKRRCIRRHSTQSQAFRLLATVTPWACHSLVFYILGIVKSAPFTDDLSVLFACSTFLFVGLAESIFCLSMPGNMEAAHLPLRGLVLTGFAAAGMIASFRKERYMPYFGLLFFLNALSWIMVFQKSSSSARARMRIRDDLVVSNYMANSRSADEFFDPDSMRGCNYIVSGDATDVTNKTTIEDSKLLTVEQIWELCSWSDGRDICLSFALFKLLRRRFRGCYLHESGLDKTRKFVFQGLLSDRHEKLRAFRIIEVELGFLFDFFYSHSSLPNIAIIFLSSILMLVSISTAVILLLLCLRPFDLDIGQNIRVFIHGVNLEAVLTSIVLGLFVALCYVRTISAASSNWQKVFLIVSLCLHHKRSPGVNVGSILSRSLLRLICLYGTSSSWSNTARQYCLLVRLPPVTSAEFSVYYVRMVHFLNSRVYWEKETESWIRTVPICKEAKQALLDALQSSRGNLTDGRSSLLKNGAEALYWACHQKFVAEKILVWHVATTLCHVPFTQKSFQGFQQQTRTNHKVAIMLSNYCAYLVACAPELLADDIYATRLAFDAARTTARKQVKSEGSILKMYESVRVMDLSRTVFTSFVQHDVVFQGKMLAAQLIKLSDDFQWKVLADFWAELMLFVSPADNAPAHLEKLKSGGELITHIWALLTHAGILERPLECNV